MKKVGFVMFLYGLWNGSVAVAAAGFAIYEFASPLPLLAFLTSTSDHGLR